MLGYADQSLTLEITANTHDQAFTKVRFDLHEVI